KPSDLQINTPPSHGSALNPASKNTKSPLKAPKIEPNPAFGEHFKEFELKGAQAVAKLLQEQRGQVARAFYRKDLGESGGYIDLVWGQAGTGKSDGWGLSKIAKYHPEVLDKLEELIQTLPIVKETPNRYQLENANYKASIRKDFEGKPGNWVLTAFEKKESIARRSTDLPSTQEGAKKTPLADTPSSVAQESKPPLKTPKIEPNPAFGEHFAEFELKGAQAVAKLLQEQRGQVAGAFYREDLGESGGYIDLVWGASATDLKGLKGANGKPLKPYGLSKILEKHASDFEGFKGVNALEKLGNGIETIIKNGNLVNDQAGVKTFILKDNGREFRVGISQGWEHEGKNYWIITAYENKKTPPAQKFDQVAAKSEHGSDLAQKGETNSTKPPLKTPKIEPNPEDFNYTTEGIKGLKELREDLKQALSPILNQDIKNKETGVIARLSSTGLNKISSSKALEKSIANGFSKEEHFKVGAGIKSLFEHATLKETYADKKASPDIKAMHRYFTRLNVNGKPAEAKITLKESVQKGHRIYSLELEELSPLP
ncbi:hypothetical protein, partial [Helicobacter bizzozeronii]